MDRVQAEAALSRALELEARSESGDRFDRAVLDRLGLELGISPQALDEAVEEVLSAPAGPMNAAAGRAIPAPAAEISAALDTMLRLRGLTTDGAGVWRQESGWWPDVFRSWAVTPVAVSIVDSGRRTVVRFMARLDRIWRAHLLAAIIAPLVAAVLLGVGELLAVLGFGLAWVAASVLGYQYRREAIRQRLDRALGELARPDYRRQPW